jgi:tRNA threonylcarbamoyladenosine biosynthesis protein TsaB
MFSLAIETSGRVGSVALVRDGVVLAEPTFEHGLKHAAGILPMIDSLCREHGVGPRDLAELYVSIGPGSFTGLRIGVTLAKTMSLTTGVKIVAVPTVAVLAANAPADAANIIIVLDAKRDQIFTASFAAKDEGGRMKDEKGEEITHPFSSFILHPSSFSLREPAHLDSLTAMLARSPRPVHLIGEGIPYHEKFIPKDDAGVIVTSPDLWRAKAGVVASIGMQMAARGEFADADRLVPLYIRMSEAEEKWEEKNLARS